MAIAVQTGIPATITAGDAVSFVVTDADFSASDWTAKIIFKDQNGVVKSFDGSASGDNHSFALTNGQTATLTAGRNSVCLQFSDGTNRQTGDWQEVTIVADPASQQEPTFAQAQVALLQKVLAEFHGTTRRSVNFSGHNFERANIADYQKQLTYYEARVLREKATASQSRPTRYRIGFVNSGRGR